MKCSICDNYFGDWRTHCPTCGARKGNETNMVYDLPYLLSMQKRIIPLIAAKGCDRQRPTYQQTKLYRSCDPDA